MAGKVCRAMLLPALYARPRGQLRFYTTRNHRGALRRVKRVCKWICLFKIQQQNGKHMRRGLETRRPVRGFAIVQLSLLRA